MSLRGYGPEALADILNAYIRTHRLTARKLAAAADLAPSTVIQLLKGKHQAQRKTLDALEQVIPRDGQRLPGLGRRDQVLRGYSLQQELAALRHALAQPVAQLLPHWTYLTEEDAAGWQVVMSQVAARRVREAAPWRQLAGLVVPRLERLAQARDRKRQAPKDVILLGCGEAGPETALLAALTGYGLGPLSVVLVDASPALLRRAEATLVRGAWARGMRASYATGSLTALGTFHGLLPQGRARLVTLLGDTLGELLLEEPLLAWFRQLHPGDLVLLEARGPGASPRFEAEATLDELLLLRLRLFLARQVAPHVSLGDGELQVTLEEAPETSALLPGSRAVQARALLRRPGQAEQQWVIPFGRSYDIRRLAEQLAHLAGLVLLDSLENPVDPRRHYLVLERAG